MTSRQQLYLLLAFVVILGGAWYKERENRLDRLTQDAWHQKIERLSDAGLIQQQALYLAIRECSGEPDARQLLEAKLNEGKPFELQPKDGWQTADWTDDTYGFEYELTFDQDKLVAWGTSWGTNSLHAVYPKPVSVSYESSAEHIRQLVAAWAWVAWLVLVVLFLFTRNYRLAEPILVCAVAAGATWLVAPNYPVTFQGVTSNDPLFAAVLMLLCSLIFLGIRQAYEAGPLDSKFSIKSLLIATTIVALLLALRPVGYVALFVLVLGLLWFTLVVKMACNNRSRGWGTEINALDQ